ncbi:MAG: dihydroorotate dehydrogenase electron transfer subunit [Candidatus Omnitrophota bacterium]
MKIVQVKAKIISNKKLSGHYWHLEFVSGEIAKSALPGQFVDLRVINGFEPLLRRPISIHGVSGDKVKIIYEVLGKGTQILSTKKGGQALDVIGPLGNGFAYKPTLKSGGAKNILIAGGIGVAPLVFLAEKIKTVKPLILIGARTKGQILCTQEFKALGCKVELATDDGSAGLKGRVTDLLKNVLEQVKPSRLFSCGPHPMLKTVSQIALENKIKAQLSLEEHMACGIGACLGCVVLTKSGYQRVCKDGPVFSNEELIW